jgi:2-methylcitrate dehydratase PrpD
MDDTNGAMEADETAALAAFVTGTEFEDVPEHTVADVKRAIRDYCGVALYGSQHPVGEHITSYVSAASPGNDATLLGGGTASAPGAALANGTYGHAIDFDDTFESIVVHPTSPVFPAALAGAELVDGEGRDVLAGYAVGVEAAFRVGHATYPSHYENGWHATGTIGAFGAAAAAASVLGLSAEETRHALGICASGSSSLKKNFGSMTKPLHAGHAAQVGVRAALLAREGWTANRSVLGGDLGYGAVMTLGDAYDPTAITDGLNALAREEGTPGTEGEWAVSDVGYKPYPSGVITHAAMDATRALAEQEDLATEDVTRVTVALDEAANEMLIHAAPEDALQAKFSIEFCLAAVLHEGDPGIREFADEYLDREEVTETMAKVERAFEPDLFDGGYAGYGARVTVETVEGETYVEEEPHAPGGPRNPVAEQRLDAKFRTCAGVVLDEEVTDRLASAIERLEQERALADLTGALRAE